jgi:NAD+ diphosphatase
VSANGNTYSGVFDRLAERRADAAWIERALAAPHTRFLGLSNGSIPVTDGDEGPQLAALTRDLLPVHDGFSPVLLGVLDGGSPWFAVDLGTDEAQPALPEGVRLADLREVGSLLPPAEAALSATARGLLTWHTGHRFCGRCGEDTAVEAAGHRRRCPGCGASHHPHIEPAVITLVTDGADRCVLGRSGRHTAGTYSVFAGFVEPGESLEAAAAREVEEEIGLQVTDVRYHSSQPWPFPAALMLGFTARATTFDIEIDPGEIREARWFQREELRGLLDEGSVSLPRPGSVARRLVEEWLHAR